MVWHCQRYSSRPPAPRPAAELDLDPGTTRPCVGEPDMSNPVSVAARRLGEIGELARVREFAEMIAKTAVYDRDKTRRYRQPLDAPVEYRAYAQALRGDGYVLIPNYRSPEYCKDLAQRLLDA